MQKADCCWEQPKKTFCRMCSYTRIHAAVTAGDCVVVVPCCEFVPQLWLSQLIVDALFQLLTVSADEQVHVDQPVTFVLLQFEDLKTEKKWRKNKKRHMYTNLEWPWGRWDCFTLFSNKAVLVSLICSVYIWDIWRYINKTAAAPHSLSVCFK